MLSAFSKRLTNLIALAELGLAGCVFLEDTFLLHVSGEQVSQYLNLRVTDPFKSLVKAMDPLPQKYSHRLLCMQCV